MVAGGKVGAEEGGGALDIPRGKTAGCTIDEEGPSGVVSRAAEDGRGFAKVPRGGGMSSTSALSPSFILSVPTGAVGKGGGILRRISVIKCTLHLYGSWVLWRPPPLFISRRRECESTPRTRGRLPAPHAASSAPITGISSEG